MARERKYRLGPDGEHELVIRWRGIWKDVEVLYDGKRRGEPIANMTELKAGREFRLPRKRRLFVRLRQGFGYAALEVLIDGHAGAEARAGAAGAERRVEGEGARFDLRELHGVLVRARQLLGEELRAVVGLRIAIDEVDADDPAGELQGRLE